MKFLFVTLVAYTATEINLFAAEAGMPQLDPKYWASQAFWLILIFLILYISIAKFYLPKIKNNLDDRENKIKDDVDDANKFKEMSESKFKEYENADIILFDTPGMEKSIKFPKNLITKLPSGDKYALAGSISEDNVENINKLGVNFFDLSSSLENQLGFKDHLKIRNFINKINELKN